MGVVKLHQSVATFADLARVIKNQNVQNQLIRYDLQKCSVWNYHTLKIQISMSY